MNREEQILSLGRVVGAIAAQLLRTLPSSVDREDLVNAGWVGAIHAVDHWDAAYSVLLSTFARRHIHGAMIDYLRELDPLSRHDRRKYQNAVREAEAIGAPAPPSPAKIISIDRGKETDDGTMALDFGCLDPGFSRTEATADLGVMFEGAGLTEREEAVVRRSCFGEETLRCISKSLGVNESRVSQIRAGAFSKLRAAA
jgi:RNA polymerase sigma factor FliA